MKYELLILLLITASTYTMENKLTKTEQDCYNWFVEAQKTLPSTMDQLSPEDRAIFDQQVKFQDKPVEVTRSRDAFAEKFYASAQRANPSAQLPYHVDFLKTTFIKMTRMMHGNQVQEPTDLLTTRMWAFSKLSSEEKMTYSTDAYKTNSDATMAVAAKWSDMVCDKLIELKQLEAAQKADKQSELLAEVKARFEKQYHNK